MLRAKHGHTFPHAICYARFPSLSSGNKLHASRPLNFLGFHIFSGVVWHIWQLQRLLPSFDEAGAADVPLP